MTHNRMRIGANAVLTAAALVLAMPLLAKYDVIVAESSHRVSAAPAPVATSSVLRSRLRSFDSTDYGQALARIESRRADLAARYRRATTSVAKAGILKEERRAFINAIRNDIIPFWYGTAWAFHGTTQIPRTGSIVYGYSVSTVLRDAGVNVQRAQLGQQASENIILSLTDGGHVKRFSDAPISSAIGSFAGRRDLHCGPG